MATGTYGIEQVMPPLFGEHRPARLQARPKTYRGVTGYVVSGTDQYGRHVSFHVRSQSAADALKAAYKRSAEPNIDSAWFRAHDPH